MISAIMTIIMRKPAIFGFIKSRSTVVVRKIRLLKRLSGQLYKSNAEVINRQAATVVIWLYHQKEAAIMVKSWMFILRIREGKVPNLSLLKIRN